MSSSYISYLYSLSNSIQYYAMWTILPTCVVGNLISLFIYSRPSLNKKTNTGFLYSWLCVLNVITIVYYSLVYRGNNMFKYTVAWPCGVDNYIRRTFLNSITWMQVIICLDRFVAVLFPAKMAFWSKRIVLYGVMLACLSVILITNMTNLLTYPTNSTSTSKNYTSSSSSTTATSCGSTTEVSIATNLIANLMRIFIPFALMLTLNLIVIYRLKQSKIKVGVSNIMQIASQLQDKQPDRQLTNKEFRFTVSTLIIDFVFLVFYLPVGINFIVLTYNQFSTSITGDSYANAVYSLFSNITQLIAMAHTSVLFLIFIIFNRYFRLELILLLRLQKLFPSLQSDGSTNATRLLNNQSQLY